MPTYEIALRVTNLVDSANLLERLGARAEKAFAGITEGHVNRAEKFAGAMERAATAAEKLAATKVPSIARTTRVAEKVEQEAGKGTEKAERYLTGPNQRLEKIREQMQRAEKEGNASALADLKILEFRASRSKELGERRLGQGQAAITSPGLLDLFQELNTLMKAGHGAGGVAALSQVAPMLGGAGGMAAGGGALAVLGPVGALLSVGLAGAGMAAKSFADSLATANRVLNEVGDAARTSGASLGQVGSLSALGVPTGDIASRAAGFREHISSDPLARRTAQAAGLNVRPRDFGGPTNEAGELLKAYEQLRKMGEGEKQLRQARIWGLESDLKFINVSEDVARQQEMLALSLGKVADKDYTRAANDLAASADIYAKSLELLKTSLAKPFIPGAIRGLQGASFGANVMARGAERVPGLGHAALAGLAASVFGPAALLGVFGGGNAVQFGGEKVGKWLAGLPGMEDRIDDITGGKKQDPAEDEHTRAMREHAQALREGTFGGGGPRARGALPANLKWDYADKALNGERLKVGPFGID
jgi:hypothetical protein